MITIAGIVERITFRSEETFYTVLQIKPMESSKTLIATGIFTSVNVGEELDLEGEWTNHPSHGQQFKVQKYTINPPKTVSGVEKYLGSGLIKGVGPSLAKKIVSHFGIEALSIIETFPNRLDEISGIGQKTREKIVQALADKKHVEKIMVFLRGHGVSTGIAVKIHKQYGSNAISIVEENPYRLCDEVWGIGFGTADRIALSIGVSSQSEQRIAAGLFHVLGQFAREGDVLVPKTILTTRSEEVLNCSESQITTVLSVLLSQNQLIAEENYEVNGSIPVYLPSLYQCERGIANRLRDLSFTCRSLMDFSIDDDLITFENETGTTLSMDQKTAIQKVFGNPITIITGGPGTGKTTTIKSIIQLMEKRALGYFLAAPTGRAAKRITETTGREAKTIHRLLEFSPSRGEGSFAKNEDNPLVADVIILDEVSMIDVPLMYYFLKAIRGGTRLVIVGDTDQLPSVGPGSVLRDMIASGRFAATKLTEVFRQASRSLIVTNAHRINKGEMPLMNARDGDFFFLDIENPDDIGPLLVDLITRRLPNKYGFNPISDIQVLTPMKLHETGVGHLNEIIQSVLNPLRPGMGEVVFRGVAFRTGDRVIQLVNNYDKEIFNGDVGIISSVSLDNKEVMVQYPEVNRYREVCYEFGELDELDLCYAMSIHKSQGSEYPVVLIPLTMQHYRMLKRNLIYTAITRAKKLAVVVGTKKALQLAVNRCDSDNRKTLLARRIEESISEGSW